MKIKVSTIVWFVVAVFFAACAFINVESDSPTWKAATYVNDATFLPENEGKIIAISGNLEPIENAVDTVVGVSFPSPFVTRTVQRFTWNDSNEEWELKYVYKGKSSDGFEEGEVVGRVKIGDFEIEPELLRRVLMTTRDVMESDFSADDLAAMNAKGHVIPEDFKCYYSTGPIDYENITKNLAWSFDNWEGDYLVNWKIWVPKPEDAATIVGIQKGNMLTYCELNYASGKTEYMDEEAFYAEGSTEVNTKPIFIVLAVICAGVGVLTIVRGKKKNAKA